MLEFCFGLLADFDSATASEALATGDVDVPVKVGRKVNLSVFNDGNIVWAKCAVKETELE